MKNERSRARYSLSLSLVVLALVGWLYLPDRFPVSPGPSVSAATSTTFTVTGAGDLNCLPAEPVCSLRAAITAANNNPGLDTIRFAITAGPEVKIISPTSELPAITDPVLIDGTTQPGYAGKPLIELSGASAGPNASGLTITGGGSTVKGLAIHSFARDGILLSGGGGNTIEGNYLGPDATGTELGNGFSGVHASSSNNLIGGTTTASRNVLSANGDAGVRMSATGNQLQGNYIGTNAAGTAALGNSNGIVVSGTNTIGGAAPGMGNVISGNVGLGIEILGSTGTKVQGNLIGTDPTGNLPIANGTGISIHSANGTIVGGNTTAVRNIISGNNSAGVFVIFATNTQILGNFIGTSANGGSLGNGSSGVLISTADGNSVQSNTIAFNGSDGITISSGTGNFLLSNLTFANAGLGIDLGDDAVTPNDAGDGDTGANNLQNFPVLTSAVLSGNNVTVRGTLNSTPNTQFSLQVFSNDECDSSGNGEGRSNYGFVTGVSTDANGNLSFTLQGPPLPPDSFLTAIAVKLLAGVGNETSEFSACRQLVTPGTLQFSSASYSVNENGDSASVTINRVGGSDGATSVFLSTSNGTATAGQDYTSTSGPINFADGQTSRTVLIPITDDSSIESSETVNLTLTPTTGGAPVGTPSAAVLTINDDDSGSVVHFSNASYNGSEDCAPVIVTVERIGDISGVSTINYSTASGTASDRTDFTAATGTLRFGPGEVEKSFAILVTEDSLTEGTEAASITLSNPSGATLGAPSVASLSILDDSSEPATNANDDSVKFVCQHYHDFLNRQPDAGGQTFWTNEIESCGANTQCREIKRINVSAAFFLSIEFQQTGYLVHRMYKVAYGNMPGAPVPLTLQEFLPDTQAIGQGVQVGIGDWQTQLENNTNAFASAFVARSRFITAFPSTVTAAQFVDALNANSGGALSGPERNQLVNDLAGGVKTRAQVLRAVAEDQTLAQAEFNKAFVLMQYFGYLRRNPNSVPDADFSGYNFWLQKLNQFGGNFVDAEMVKSFLVSGEYRQRFGP